MVFHWSLSDSKSPQVSWTLLKILAVLNNVEVWMVFTPPPTSKWSSSFNSPLVTVSNAPITIGIIVTFIFHSFFLIPWQDRGSYSCFFWGGYLLMLHRMTGIELVFNFHIFSLYIKRYNNIFQQTSLITISVLYAFVSLPIKSEKNS